NVILYRIFNNALNLFAFQCKMYLGHVKVLLGMFLSLKTLYRKRTVIWPFYFYTIIRTLSIIMNGMILFINLDRVCPITLIINTFIIQFEIVPIGIANSIRRNR